MIHYNIFIVKLKGKNPKNVKVPVIVGHAAG
ncbi:MAG: hypothetical protein ACFC1C_02865 [Candidatus Malihini olakiniferum]